MFITNRLSLHRAPCTTSLMISRSPRPFPCPFFLACYRLSVPFFPPRVVLRICLYGNPFMSARGSVFYQVLGARWRNYLASSREGPCVNIPCSFDSHDAFVPPVERLRLFRSATAGSRLTSGARGLSFVVFFGPLAPQWAVVMRFLLPNLPPRM